MEFLPEISLISVVVATIGMLVLAFIVFIADRKNEINKVFLFFSVITASWGILNYLSYNSTSEILVLWLFRFVIFFATWQAFGLFLLFYVISNTEISFSRFFKFVIIPIVVFTSLLTLTPLLFIKLKDIPAVGRVSEIDVGPAIIIFGAVAISLIIGGIANLVRKIIQFQDQKHKNLILILVGVIITFSLIIIFNFIFPVFLSDPRFVSFGAVFILPFLAFTAYAILKHGLFNVKVIATELLVFAIWIAVLIEFLMESSLKDRLFTGAILGFVIIAGIFLIRSVKKEVSQREELEKLTHELQHANEELKQLDKAKSEFVSIASHQLRTPLSITKGYVSMILENIYGDTSDKIKEVLQKVYVTNEGLIALVNNLLDLSRMEAGTLKYDFVDADFEKMVDEIVMELELEAKHRDLYLKWQKPKELLPAIKADVVKLKQVIEILIENSLKYTPKGGVDVSLGKDGDALLFKVKDTGIGVDPKELGHLFNKFGRGAEGSKVNATGVGLGLYAAKQIVLAHKGEVWVESEGIGRGSTFCVGLPFIIEQDKSLAGLRSGEGE